MNTHQIMQLEPPQIESLVYTNPASSDLEIALSAELLDMHQSLVDCDSQIETAENELSDLETESENTITDLENKVDLLGELLFDIAEIVGIYDHPGYSNMTNKEKIGHINGKLKVAKSKDII